MATFTENTSLILVTFTVWVVKRSRVHVCLTQARTRLVKNDVTRIIICTSSEYNLASLVWDGNVVEGLWNISMLLL